LRAAPSSKSVPPEKDNRGMSVVGRGTISAAYRSQPAASISQRWHSHNFRLRGFQILATPLAHGIIGYDGAVKAFCKSEPAEMTTQVRDFLESFDTLSELDKRELATEILKRSQMLDVPPLTDVQLLSAAEETFLELDRREAHNA
jgi:hypothetical protein